MPLYLLALSAGLSFVVQQTVNANLRLELESSWWAGFCQLFRRHDSMLLMIILAREPVLSGTNVVVSHAKNLRVGISVIMSDLMHLIRGYAAAEIRRRSARPSLLKAR